MVAAKLAPWVGKAGKVLAPAGQVLGKVATPVAFVGAGVQLATAKTSDDYIDAGMSTVSASLIAAPHPLAKAAGAGIAAGQLIEQTLDVSDYSSAIGIKTKEFRERIGAEIALLQRRRDFCGDDGEPRAMDYTTGKETCRRRIGRAARRQSQQRPRTGVEAAFRHPVDARQRRQSAHMRGSVEASPAGFQ
jgi:hypothetical protein